MTTNRYAPPRAVVEDRDAAGQMWREGKLLVLRPRIPALAARTRLTAAATHVDQRR